MNPPVTTQPMSMNMPPRAPITTQPLPAGLPDCPPGLEYLTLIDQVLIKQKIELAEVICGCEIANKYELLNTMAQRIYLAEEDSDFIVRQCCDNCRPLKIKVFDNNGVEVIRVDRPLRCTGCLCPCCLQKIEVQAPPGTPVGYVLEEWTLCFLRFIMQNHNKEPVMLIKGPCLCRLGVCCEHDFRIMSLNGGVQVGLISKHWSGLLTEFFTDADIFGVSFPLDLEVRMKATTLGAAFLIDYMYFEE